MGSFRVSTHLPSIWRSLSRITLRNAPSVWGPDGIGGLSAAEAELTHRRAAAATLANGKDSLLIGEQLHHACLTDGKGQNPSPSEIRRANPQRSIHGARVFVKA